MSEWISVKDKLPKNEEIVSDLYEKIIVFDGEETGVATYYDNHFHVFSIVFGGCSTKNLVLINVSHWMPFPKPPPKAIIN